MAGSIPPKPQKQERGAQRAPRWGTQRKLLRYFTAADGGWNSSFIQLFSASMF
jgi:hypothetical protein